MKCNKCEFNYKCIDKGAASHDTAKCVHRHKFIDDMISNDTQFYLTKEGKLLLSNVMNSCLWFLPTIDNTYSEVYDCIDNTNTEFEVEFVITSEMLKDAASIPALRTELFEKYNTEEAYISEYRVPWDVYKEAIKYYRLPTEHMTYLIRPTMYH